MPTPPTHTISCALTALNARPPICLSCGAELTPTLAFVASLRCHDCRASQAPISAHLIRDQPPSRSERAPTTCRAGHRERSLRRQSRA
jgi:hypothetical protein